MADSRSRTWRARSDVPEGGLRAVAIFDGALQDDTVGSESCVAATNPGGSAQIYFALDRPHPFALRPLRFRVEVLADRAGSLAVEYDSADRSVRVVPRLPGAFKRTASISLTATGAWQTVCFEIPDPRFCRSVNGADLRLVSDRAPDDPLRIRAASIDADSLAAAESSPPIALCFDDVADPVVSLVVPVFDRIDLTLECLAAVAATTPERVEVIVVSDGSTDATAATLRRVPGLRFFENDVNRGFAHTCNRGARQARAPRLLFLNNDTIPTPGWLAPMLAALERDPAIGIVGSRLLFPETGEVQHAGVDISDDAYPSHRLELAAGDDPAVLADARVPAVTGACLLVRKDVFERCGGFDEAYRNGFEDLDLCLRAHQLGFETLYCAASVLFHHVSASEGRNTHDVRNLEIFRARWGATRSFFRPTP